MLIVLYVTRLLQCLITQLSGGVYVGKHFASNTAQYASVYNKRTLSTSQIYYTIQVRTIDY